MLLLLAGLKVYKYHLFVKENNFVFIRTTQEFIILLLTVGLISAAGYLVNDIVDIDVDKVNKPQKKLAFSKKVLWFIYFLMNGFALVLASLNSHSIVTFVILISSMILLFFYSKVFQKLPLIGNLVVAFLAGILPILYHNFDSILISSHGSVSLGISYQTTLLSYVFLGFFVTLFREIIKDIEDIKGDIKGGYKTLVILLGTNTLISYLLFFMLFVLATFLFLIIPNLMTLFFLDQLLIALGIIFYVFSMSSVYNHNFTKASLFLKLTLFTGVLILFIL